MAILTFQLTRPMRGVTTAAVPIFAAVFISTHTPHAGRDNSCTFRVKCAQISTHTPHAGRDYAPKSSSLYTLSFQLTRPMRGVTSDTDMMVFDEFQFQLTRPMRGVTN